MATLSIDSLSLEIAYRDYDYGWVWYNIWLRWRGMPVINDAILKRHNEYWAKRGEGAIIACEHAECGILPLLRTVLETNEADFWEAIEHDVLLALYPGGGFPFLPSKYGLGWEDPEARELREALDQERVTHGRMTADIIEVVLFADVYNFAGAGVYGDNGICFRLSSTREELRHFYQTLRDEYVLFRERYSVEAHVREDFGPDYDAWF